MWAIVGTTFWATKVSPQTLQWDPWVNPVVVQVASTASSTTGVWLKASITLDS